MAVSNSDVDPVSEPRTWFRWRWLFLGLIITFTVLLCGLQFRNQQQWSRVHKFQRSVKAAGGTSHLRLTYGTDFLELGFAREGGPLSQFSWSRVHVVHLFEDSQPNVVDWSLAPGASLEGLLVGNPEFTDESLQAIPSETPLRYAELDSPRITNASVAKILEFPKLDLVRVSKTSIDGRGVMQLLTNRNLYVRAKLTGEDLTAIAERGLLNQLDELDLHLTDNFDWHVLKGSLLRWRILMIHGRLDAAAFAGCEDYLKQCRIVVVENAKVDANALVNLSRLPELCEVLLVNCDVSGEALGDDQGLSPKYPEIEFWVREGSFAPSDLRAFTPRNLSIHCDARFVDDDWVDTVAKQSGVKAITVYGNTVSDDIFRRVKSSQHFKLFDLRGKSFDDHLRRRDIEVRMDAEPRLAPNRP